MQFRYGTLLAAAALLTTATASPAAAPAAAPEPQSDAQITKFADDLLAYVTATLVNSPEYTSVVSFIEDNASASAALASWDNNVAAMIESGQTSVADVVSPLPTELQSFYSSVYQEELSIAYKDGVLTKPTGASTTSASGSAAAASATSSTDAKGAAPTVARGVGLVGGVMAAAVVGVMAL